MTLACTFCRDGGSYDNFHSMFGLANYGETKHWGRQQPAPVYEHRRPGRGLPVWAVYGMYMGLIR